MQEETEVLGENLHGQVWIENQIHIWLWPDWESNPGRIGERHGNNRCANLPAHMCLYVHIFTFSLKAAVTTLKTNKQTNKTNHKTLITSILQIGFHNNSIMYP